jgi:DNA-binding beta-propeller fold protein YncE
MNYRIFFGVAIVSLFVCGVAHSSPVATSGQDNLVEWETTSSWTIPTKPVDMAHSLDGKYVYILNDANQVQVFDKAGKLQGSIPVSEGVTGIDIAPQGETLYLIDKAANSFKAVSVSFVHTLDTAGSPFEGPADAPITIAVFTDFE